MLNLNKLLNPKVRIFLCVISCFIKQVFPLTTTPPRGRVLPEEPKLIPLGMKFDGDPQQLGFILAQVFTFMQVYGKTLPSKEARVWVVT